MRKSDLSALFSLLGAVSAASLFVWGIISKSTSAVAAIACVAGICFYALGYVLMHVYKAHEEKFERLIEYPAPRIFQNDYRDELRPVVESKMDVEFSNIVSLSNRVKDLLKAPGQILEIERVRKELDDARESYESNRSMLRSFGFNVRSERKRAKALRKQMA